jgi:hypothetical protein
MSNRSVQRRRWAAACAVFVVGQVILRLYWIGGGRWGYTACDRTDLGDPAGGCGADRIVALPFWPGWGAVAAGAVLTAILVWTARRPGRPAAFAAWTAAMVLLVTAFPLHLLFEIPAALGGRPSDWRDLGARLALVVGGALFIGLAGACAPAREPGTPAYRPVSRWARRWAYAAVVLPVVGWAVPHGLWLLGVPFGIPDEQLDAIRHDLSMSVGVAITFVPPLAGLLVLGLIQRWGQQFPAWVPVLGDRRVPPLLAVVPAGTVAISLITYGVLSVGVFVSRWLRDDLSGAEVRDGWAVTATLLVFLGWGVALGVTTVGYALATRAGGPPRTEPADLTAAR